MRAAATKATKAAKAAKATQETQPARTAKAAPQARKSKRGIVASKQIKGTPAHVRATDKRKASNVQIALALLWDETDNDPSLPGFDDAAERALFVEAVFAYRARLEGYPEHAILDSVLDGMGIPLDIAKAFVRQHS